MHKYVRNGIMGAVVLGIGYHVISGKIEERRADSDLITMTSTCDCSKGDHNLVSNPVILEAKLRHGRKTAERLKDHFFPGFYEQMIGSRLDKLESSLSTQEDPFCKIDDLERKITGEYFSMSQDEQMCIADIFKAFRAREGDVPVIPVNCGLLTDVESISFRDSFKIIRKAKFANLYEEVMSSDNVDYGKFSRKFDVFRKKTLRNMYVNEFTNRMLAKHQENISREEIDCVYNRDGSVSVIVRESEEEKGRTRYVRKIKYNLSFDYEAESMDALKEIVSQRDLVAEEKFEEFKEATADVLEKAADAIRGRPKSFGEKLGDLFK